MTGLRLELPPDVLEQIVREVTARVRAELASESGHTSVKWLTLEQAGLKLGCTPDAVRMRVKRGRLECRRHGRRIYVSAHSVDELI